MSSEKDAFISALKQFAETLTAYVSDKSNDWKVKGFIDTEHSIYGISSDTKIISKLLEIQLFPLFLEFAKNNNYHIVLAEKQNWYPDLTFIHATNASIKFAVDIKTTYRLDDYEGFCNGFTLGSHGEYFKNRLSTKNIQFPYGSYLAHVTLGILYTRASTIALNETRKYDYQDLNCIPSVTKDFLFFAEEKWKIASDKSGSGNTANIGSIDYIPDILAGNGVFINLGESIFDEYWINQGILKVPTVHDGKVYKTLTKLSEFLDFKNLSKELINPRKVKRKNKA